MATVTKIRNGSKRRNAGLTSTGGAKVAARKRRRKPNASATHRTGTTRAANYRRRTNPRRNRTRRHRRHNPSMAGLGGKILFAAIGAIAVKFISPLVPFGNNSPWSNIGKELLVGYGLGFVGERLLKLSPDKVDGLIIGGMSVGAVDAINTLLPSLNTMGFQPLNAATSPQAALAAANQQAAQQATNLGMLVQGPGTNRNQMGALVQNRAGRRAPAYGQRAA